MKTTHALLLLVLSASSASAQWLTVSGGGTINIGQSANITASPSTGLPTGYQLLENGGVVQSVGTFGISGGQDMGSPYTFTVSPSVPGTYVYTAYVHLNISRGQVDVYSSNSVTVTVVQPHPPSVAISGDTSLTVGQPGNWSFSASDPDGNLTAWWFHASTNTNNNWSPTSGSPSGSYSTSFGAAGDYTWVIEARDSDGLTNSASLTVHVTNPVTYTLTTGTSGSGTGTVSPGGTYSADTQVTVSASANGQSTFAGWSGAASGISTSVTVLMDANKTVIANFDSPAPQNSAPTIIWTSTPGTVSSGVPYSVSAHGHDDDGNLVSVVITNTTAGTTFASAGTGNSFNSDASNSRSDTGPASVVFTAYAVDSNGAQSPTISQTVTISAPSAVTASISASPSAGTAPLSTTISWTTANATSVSVSGPGMTASTAASGSASVGNLAGGTYTYTLTAQGPGGPVTRTATVTISDAAPTVSGSISVSPASATAPGSTTVTWSTSNATAVAVSGNGISSASTTGSVPVSGLNAGTYTYTLTAQGNGGPVTRTAIFQVDAAPTVTASITANPATANAPGSTSIAWATSNATSASVVGPGLNATSLNGTQSITGLATGSYTYTLTAQGNGGSITRTATVTVSSTPAVTATLTATPTTTNAPGTISIAWTTTNASSVGVSGPNLSSTLIRGSQRITGLSAGSYTYTLSAQGVGGPITRTATATVTAASLGASITMPATVVRPISGATTQPIQFTGNSANGTLQNYRYAILRPDGTTQEAVAWTPFSTTTTTQWVASGYYDYQWESSGYWDSVWVAGYWAMETVWVPPYYDCVGAGGVDMDLYNSWAQRGYPTQTVYAPDGSGVEVSDYLTGPFYFYQYPGYYTTENVWHDGYWEDQWIDTSGLVYEWIDTSQWVTVTKPNLLPNGSATDNLAITSAYVLGVYTVNLDVQDAGGNQASASGTFQVLASSTPYSVTVNVSPAGAGTVSGPGSYAPNATATLLATNASGYQFAGFTGDLVTSANPASFAVDNNYVITANFLANDFTLTTTASGGGTVSAGGVYPAGSSVTVTATDSATARFSGWTGDASGTANPLLVTMTSDKNITGLFTAKLAQAITFSPPTSVRLLNGMASIPLTASASSGLPVTLTLVNGPAALIGGTLTLAGTGPVLVQATQPGDSTYLPAPIVQRTINGVPDSVLIQNNHNDKLHSTEAPGNASLIRTHP